jgi:AbrB family looped-hinge helix DNA binding protein
VHQRAAVDSAASSSTSSLTSKGQVTIPKALRQQLGLARGSRVRFELVGDHIELRPLRPDHPLPVSGFGMLQSQRPPLPADFDPASLLQP